MERRAARAMDIRWLEDLLALAERRNFRNAAEQRHITPQSGLSRRSSRLSAGHRRDTTSLRKTNR